MARAVEVEEVAEGEGVIGRVLFEQDGEVDIAVGCAAVDDKGSSGEGGRRAEDEEDKGDALSGADARVGDGEGGGLVGLFVEPSGDKEDERGQGREDVVLLPGGEGEEEHDKGGPDAEEQTRALERGERWRGAAGLG